MTGVTSACYNSYMLDQSQFNGHIEVDFKEEDENDWYESPCWDDIRYEDKYLENYLWQNFNIQPAKCEKVSASKLQLPRMVPGTKNFMDCDLEFDDLQPFNSNLISPSMQNMISTSSENISPLNNATCAEKHSQNFGHLLNFMECNEDSNVATPATDFKFFDEKRSIIHASNNQVVLPQNENFILTDMVSDSIVKTEQRKEEISHHSASIDSFQCLWSGCGKKLLTQQALVYHIEKSHVDSRKSDEFICEWKPCPRNSKPFNARYKLLIHMRVHSGEKPNKCPFPHCKKAFSRLENLKIHQRSHTGERPYACQFSSCTKAFSNSSDRAKHQRTHFDQKPYACQIEGCNKRYTDPSSLRKHIKNHSSPQKQRSFRKQHCTHISTEIKKHVNQNLKQKRQHRNNLTNSDVEHKYNEKELPCNLTECEMSTSSNENENNSTLLSDNLFILDDEYIPYDSLLPSGINETTDEFLEHLLSQSENGIQSSLIYDSIAYFDFKDAIHQERLETSQQITNMDMLIM